MSFRRHLNRHDAWIKNCEESAAKLVEIGLYIAVFESQQELAEFLTSGRHDDLKLDFNEVPDPTASSR